MKKFTRRDFVKCTALAAAGMSLQNPMVEAAAKKARKALAPTIPNAGEKVVVVINLFGGNDGLNTVIPTTTPGQYDDYLALRPLSGIGFDLAELAATNLDGSFALRPEMTPFKQLWDSNNLAVINGVGVPLNARRKYDHSAQQDTFQSCDIDGSVISIPTGWMGRYCDGAPLGQIPPGIDLGGGRLMVSGNVRKPVSIYSLNDFTLRITADAAEKAIRRSTYEAIMATAVPEGGVGELERQYRVNALAQSEAIFAAIADYPTPPYGDPASPYQNNSFHRQMQEAAKLIYADIGAQCIGLGIGGFDSHGDQEADVNGMPYHGYLWNRVTTGVKALYDDLVTFLEPVRPGISNRVLIVTISEFGRTPWQNTDLGTDHGIASSAFVVGTSANVNPGVYGTYPGLKEDDWGNEQGLITTVDFRSVYATIAANFLGVDPEPIVDPDNENPPFPLLTFC
jgi:uncharacterized protein (DUF1501 family)